MILSSNFYIDMTRWFKDQFLLSKHLYNQTRYIIKNEPKFPKNTEIEHKLKSYQDDFNNYRKLCKAKVGINLATQEESYTSKYDSLAFEKIGFHDNDKYKYKGERIKRGMFKSSIGKIINADINGALNILRKYLKAVEEFSVIQKIIDRGLILRPYIINVN